MDGSIQVRFFQLTVSILIACPGPDEPKIYKKQYKRHCVIIEELLEAGAEDDELGNSIFPDIPDKCAEVISLPSQDVLASVYVTANMDNQLV